MLPDATEAVDAAALRLVGENPRDADEIRELRAAPEPPHDPGIRRLKDLAITLSLPAWAAARLRQTCGVKGALRLGRALLHAAPVDLRVNTLKTDRGTLAVRLSRESGVRPEPTEWSPWGLRMGERIPLQNSPAFREGWFEVQDEGSQLVALATGARAGETVIDACAGGGGKTLALAAMMENRGRIIATDPEVGRLRELRKRCRRAGVTNTSFVPIPRRGEPPARVPDEVDCVLVDAPCSGSGTWRRAVDLKTRYRESELARMAHTQYGILERFAVRVRSGGRLVYATCSLFEDENEAVVDRFLQSHPEWSLAAPPELLELKGSDAWLDEDVARLDPVRSNTDGFFIARLVRQHAP
jgi:16S rRNA (cytosine967-C5)-methyltransferase